MVNNLEIHLHIKANDLSVNLDNDHTKINKLEYFSFKSKYFNFVFKFVIMY